MIRAPHNPTMSGVWVRRLTVPEYIATVKSAVGVNIEKQAASQTMKLQRFDFFVTLVCLAVFSLTLAGDQLNAAPQIGESTSKLSRKQLKEYEVEAHGLIRAGKEWDAEQTIIGHCKEIAKKYGEDSHEHAQMLYIQATVYAGMRNLESATEALRRAGDIPGTTQQGKKDRLTYLMNLGEFLILTKKRDEAEKVLRKGLEQREEFYGKDHSGYAFGQEALAKVLIAQRKYGEAFLLCEEAVKLEFENKNPHVAEDVTTMAYALAGTDPEENLWPMFEQLSPELRHRAIGYAQVIAHEMEPAISLLVFESLNSNLEKFKSSDANDKLSTLIAIANSAWGAEKPKKRIKAFKEALPLLPPKSPSISDIHLALADAYEDLKEIEKVESSYKEAVDHSEEIGNQQMLARSLREFGLWLGNDKKDLEQADVIHKRSVEVASKLNDLPHGQALCAYGIFVQHQSKHELAAKLLKKAVELLPDGHPHLFAARNHLPFAERGEKCKCGESGKATMVELLNEMLAKRLPEDLFKELVIDENNEYHVETKRKPTAEELDLIKRALDNAKNKLTSDR